MTATHYVETDHGSDLDRTFFLAALHFQTVMIPNLGARAVEFDSFISDSKGTRRTYRLVDPALYQWNAPAEPEPKS